MALRMIGRARLLPAQRPGFHLRLQQTARLIIAGTLLLGLLVSCSSTSTALPVIGAFTKLSDLIYANDANGELRLDLYLPDTPAANPVPVVVMMRGGGFRSTDKEAFAPLAGAMADRGIAAASIEYRGSAQALFPGATEDSKAAVRWLRVNAGSYGLDAEAITLMGGSAGGYLVAYHGVTEGLAEVEGMRGNPQVSSAVQAVVALAPESGPSALSAWTEYLGETDGRDEQKRQFASALTHVDEAAEPPLLLMHGTADSVVPISESERLQAAYEESANLVEFVAISNAPHSFWFQARYFSQMMDRAAAFVLTHTACGRTVSCDD